MKYGNLLVTIVSPCLFVYGLFLHSCQDPATYVPAQRHLSAKALSASYDENEIRSDSLYLYKILSINGVVRKILKNEMGHFVAMIGASGEPESAEGTAHAVDCSMDSLYDRRPLPIQLGDSVTIRGTCAGRLSNV